MSPSRVSRPLRTQHFVLTLVEGMGIKVEREQLLFTQPTKGIAMSDENTREKKQPEQKEEEKDAQEGGVGIEELSERNLDDVSGGKREECSCVWTLNKVATDFKKVQPRDTRR